MIEKSSRLTAAAAHDTRLKAATPEERAAQFEALLAISAAVNEFAQSPDGLEALNITVKRLAFEHGVTSLRQLSGLDAVTLGASGMLMMLRFAYQQIGGFMLGVTDEAGEKVVA